MKKNAGPMKLSLAQFRELESFSQFDSDIDPKTRQVLDRGRRTIEVMKQSQWNPMPVALQVVSIFAVNEGIFDDLEINEIKNFESKIHEHFTNTAKDLLDKLEKEWNDEIKNELLLKLKDLKQLK
jgi:F-type H+-transporting ATPase subunit alpha